MAREVIGEFQTVVLGHGGMPILTYLYGTRRLARLAGPSVAEFRADAPSPWIGQPRGF